jgi:hypothetical protein
MIFHHPPGLAAYGRNGLTKEQGKELFARTRAPDAPVMHENNLVDQ